MRRSVIAVALVILLCSPLPSRGQAVVIDPSQIAASAVNAADQLDYMFDQLGELAHLGDQLSTVRGYIDEVFGDDGVGGKTISILNDLGTLDRLTQSYLSTIRSTEQLAQTMREMEQFRLSDANMMLTYLRQMKSQAEMAIETAKSIINTLGFSRKEKKDEVEATQIATSLTDFSDYLDETLEGDDYVQTLEVYGSLDEAGEGGLGIISLILGLLTIVSAVRGYIIYSRGSIPGDPVADNVMFRVAAGFAAGLVALEFISYVMGFNL